MAAHYDRTVEDEHRLHSRLQDLRAEIQDARFAARAEREALFAMLNLMYKGLVLRLDPVRTEEVPARATVADEAHRKLLELLAPAATGRELGDLIRSSPRFASRLLRSDEDIPTS